jgi:hypothetical protein
MTRTDKTTPDKTRHDKKREDKDKPYVLIVPTFEIFK